MTYWLAQTENNARASAAGFASTLPWKASGQLGTGVGAGGAEFQLQKNRSLNRRIQESALLCRHLKELMKRNSLFKDLHDSVSKD